MTQYLEDFIPVVRYEGLNSQKNGILSGVLTFSGANVHSGVETHSGAETHSGVETHSGAETHSGLETFASLSENVSGAGIAVKHSTTYRNTLSALNSTGTITAAMLATGGITSTSAAGVTATLDSVANIATQFGALTAGFVIPFWVQNPGSNTVTVAVSAGIVAAKQVSSGDTAVDVLLTVAASATVGSAKFEIVFISATAAVLHRVY